MHLNTLKYKNSKVFTFVTQSCLNDWTNLNGTWLIDSMTWISTKNTFYFLYFFIVTSEYKDWW